jgi:hypothetical protein
MRSRSDLLLRDAGRAADLRGGLRAMTELLNCFPHATNVGGERGTF